MSALDELILVAKRLPPEVLEELLDLARARQQERAQETPYHPVALGGLWQGVVVTDDDLRQARKEVWRRFGESREVSH